MPSVIKRAVAGSGEDSMIAGVSDWCRGEKDKK
jgi:hypothetical protein